ncbi:recombinase family protein [Patescibacteria group bacterium]
MKEDKKLKYFIYARKSSESEDRQVQSIDDQVEELQKLAKNSDLEVVNIFSESKSAKAPNRPIFNEMLEKIRNGEANGILCWKLNRLARNPIDGGEISWMLQEGSIQHIQTYGRGYSPNDNVIMMSVEFGMANQFIRDLRVDTKRGLKAKAEKGWYPSFATLGYMNNPLKHKGDKEIIKDSERFDLVRKIFDLMLAGDKTPPQILEIAKKEWGLKNRRGGNISRSNIYRILSDPFYYGEFEYPKNSNNWYQGKHEPMITREEYDKIQFLLGKDRKSERPKKYEFAFRGPILCGECGAMVTAEHKVKRQKNGVVRNYIYYHCTKRKNIKCSQKSIEENKLKKQIVANLGSIEIPKSFHKWAVGVLKSQNEVESVSRDKILGNLNSEYNQIVKKIDNIIDMRAGGELTKEEFETRKNNLTTEKLRLSNLLKDTDQRIDSWLEKAERYFDFAENVTERFNNGDLEIKKGILFALGSNLLLKDCKITIYLSEPLKIIKKMSSEVKEINRMFEPQKSVENKRTLGDLYSQSPVLLRRQDSNLRPSD